MASATDICNLALGQLGADRITNFENPETPNEQLCNLYYPIVRDMLLEERDWSFLMKRATLTIKDSPAPDWGFASSFTLPSDCYRIINARRNTQDGAASSFNWKREGDKILCDIDVVYIRYITSDVATVAYSGIFVMAFATALASFMCMQLTENRSLKVDLLMQADELLVTASANDGMQGKHEQIHASELVNARTNGGYR